MTGMFVGIVVLYFFSVFYIWTSHFKLMDVINTTTSCRFTINELQAEINKLKFQIEQNRYKINIPFSNEEKPDYRNPFATMTKIVTTSTTETKKKHQKRRNRGSKK